MFYFYFSHLLVKDPGGLSVFFSLFTVASLPRIDRAQTSKSSVPSTFIQTEKARLHFHKAKRKKRWIEEDPNVLAVLAEIRKG